MRPTGRGTCGWQPFRFRSDALSFRRSYDLNSALFPFQALSREARNLYLPRVIDTLSSPPDSLTFLREYVGANVPVSARISAPW